MSHLPLRRFPKLTALFGSGLMLATSVSVALPAIGAVAQSNKIVQIVEENESYDNIIGSAQAPYINQLIAQGTVFINYSALASSSNPNYLGMTSGLQSPLSPPSPNIFQAIDGASGLSWKEFSESMTGTCGAGTTAVVPGNPDPLYTTEHDPVFAYQGNTSCATNDVPLTSSSFNPSTLPSFSYVVPNQCDDMHTPPSAGQACPAYFGPNAGTSPINMGDNWLAAVIPQLLAQPNVTVLITWDESSSVPPNHVVTLELGAGVTQGGIDANPYSHYSLEAGLYNYFGLGTAPNNGATAPPLPIPDTVAPPYPGLSNPVARENSKPGTINWKIAQEADGVNQQIDGYASATSVNLGQQITFYVSVNPGQSFSMDFYRFGYYQGLGGRFILNVPNLAGVVQPSCPMDSTTGMIACNWAPSYQLTIPTTWVSGAYLVKLTNAAGYQSYIIFVVRDDARHAALLYQLAFNNYEAYNNWPNDPAPGGKLPQTGKDLYDQDSSTTLTGLGTQRAVQVSFDRPFAETDGSGGFLDYEANDVGWLEQQGYDLGYTSSVDVDLSPSNLLNHNGFISGGHDEYWSMTMYNNLAQARDRGVNLAWLSADDVSWQVRFAPNAAGVPDRQIICYKSATLDPVQNNTITVHFHDPQVNVPEQLLVGGNSAGVQLGVSSATPVPYIVQNASNWVYANTGAVNGQSVPNVVGYEIQAYNSAFPSPTSAPNTYQLLSSSPITNTNNVVVNQNATIYQAASGAWVFSAGSIEWGWALFDFGFPLGGQGHADYASPFIQTMTANVLNKFSAGTLPLPIAPTNLTATPAASSVALNWTDNDANATYELDRSAADSAFSTFTAIKLPAGTTSYTDSGLSPAVYYYRLVAVGANGESPYVSAFASTIAYASLVAARAGLLAHWRLGETSGTTAFDTTGTYNGTYVNAPTLGSPGAINNDPSTSVTFNGSSQRVTVPTLPAAATDFSIEGWTYLTNASVNNNTIFGSASLQFLARPGTGSFTQAAFAGVTLNGTTYSLQPTSPASNINTWVDWVVTRQGGTLTLYRNGVQIAQRTDLPATATISLSGWIADESNSAFYLTGRVQDVAVYSQALSGDDVANGYAAGLNAVAPPPPPIHPLAPTNFAAVPSASTVSLTWTDSDTTSSYWLYRGTDPGFQNPATINLPPGANHYTDTGLGQGVFYYKLVASNTGGQSPAVLATAATISYTGLVNGRNGLLGHWRLGETSGSTAWDTTGSYNGVYINSPTLGSPGAISNDPSTSVTFNGSSQRVNLPTLPAAATDFSIEGWTYLTNASVNNNTIFGSGTLQFLARPGTGSNPNAAYAGVTLNGTTYVLQPNSPASNINTWVDFVVTRQGGTLTLYRNGVQISQRTDLPPTATVSLSGYIADESNGSYYLTGRVQDVAVYTRALTSLDVTNSYIAAVNGLTPAGGPASTTPYYNAVRSESSLLAYWRLGESSGTTANDALGRSNGTYVGSPTLGSTGAIVNDPDTSVTFNGSNQRVNLPTLPTVGDFTIEGWTNLTNPNVNNNTVYGNGSTVQLLARPGNASFPTAAYAAVTLNGTTYVLQPNSPSSNLNTWVYWVVTRQGGTLTLYRNAVQISQRTDLPPTATTPLNGYLGAEPNGAYYLTGQMDEVAVYNVALTPQDITSHYQAAQSGPAPHATAPPSVAVTQPANAATYGTNWPGAISGTAVSNSGFALTSVSVAVRDTTTGKWWGGSGFTQSSQTFFPVTSGTSSWSMTFPGSNFTSGHSFAVTAQATDYVFNTATSAAVAFTYINAPPTVTVNSPSTGTTYGPNWVGAVSGTAQSNSGFALTGVTVALQDLTTGRWWSGSGFTQPSQTFVPVTSGTSNWSLTVAASNLTSGHGYSATAQTSDTLGNVGSSSAIAFTYSTSAPFTAIACNGAACSSGWYNAPVSVTLSVTDNSGAGINATYYTTDGSTPTSSSPRYTGAFTVSQSSTVRFFSIDKAGNVEPVESQTIQIDTVAPSTTIACNGVACSSGWYSAPVSVTLSASDNPGGSGVSATYYTTDGSLPTTASAVYAGAFTVSSASPIQYFSVDNAGNAESVKVLQLQVDTIAPTTTIACNGAACATTSYQGTVSVTLSATDNQGGSGVAATYYTTDGSAPTTSSTPYSGAFSLVKSSSVRFFSVDTVGNIESAKQQQVQVTAILVSIAVNPATPSIAKGNTQAFTATGTYSDGSTQDVSGSVAWASSNAAVASITSSGVATGTGQGSSQISASSGTVSGSTTLTVGPAVLTSISVNPANPSIAKGTTQQFSATGTYSDGTTLDVSGSATWASSNPSVAPITPTGLASGASQGSSQISATVGSISGSTTLTVGPAVLTSIAVGDASIPKGTTQQFSATGTYSDGSTQDVTSAVAWASSNASVASITGGGLATAIAQGTSQISATAGSVTGSATLTVGPAVLTSIAVTPANPTIPKTTSEPFTATGSYSDGSTQDLTSAVTWSSSNTGVATITTSGVATGVTQGTSQIGAASGATSGSTTATVGPPPLVSIAVSPLNPSIAKGLTQQFSATATYADGSTQDVTSSVSWASSDTTLATISASGLATGVGQGTPQISASANGISNTTTLTVGPATLASIAVTPANRSVAQGNAQQFAATGTYSDGTTQDLTGAVTWASSNPTVATVTAGGLASGIAVGSSQISATSGSVTGGTTLTVGPPTLVSIAITPTNPSIAKGLTQQFTATGTYSDGTTLDMTSSVAWSSATPAVATITAGGLASGAGPGSSQIGASSGAISGSTTLTVGPALLASIAIAPANPSIPNGTSQQLSATGTYSDGSTQDLTNAVSWASSVPSVATISSGGLATGVAQGTTQLTASSNGTTGGATLTVGPAVLASIVVMPTNPSIAKGTTQQFAATGFYSDGSAQDLTSSVTWTAATTSVASITAGGLASGAGQGTSQITATSGAVVGSTTLTVTPPTLASIAVTPANPSIPKGSSQQFTATGTYSDGSTQDLTSAVNWTPSDSSIATITASGLATGVAQGTAQITATSGAISGSTTLTVGPAVLASITVTPANPSIAYGTTQQFTASGTYTDASTQDLTGSVTWASSNSAAATISGTGLASGAAQGTSQISATSGTVTGSTTLTIGPPALTSIAVTPANPSIAKGTTQQFTATGTYSDGSTQDVTGSVTWASSTTSVATIAASGLATGTAPGSSQISATSGAIAGSTTLTVGPAVLVSIAVAPANPSIAKGLTQQFTATGIYSDASTQDLTTSVTWASSNGAVATVNGAGLASGAAQGTSQISATSGGVTGGATLTVGPPALASIALTPATPSIAQGNTQQFTATGTYTDGSKVDVTSSVTWASANTTVATITAGGLASGVAQGSSQISATSGAVSASTTMTVGPATLVSIAVTPANPSIAKGLTQQFTATGTYTDRSTQNLTSTAAWASSNSAVATISAAGLASGVAQGSSQISATSGAVTGSTTLTVGPATLVSIAITPANPSIAKGNTQQFTATGTYTDVSTLDITSSVTWASATTSVATITAAGLTTAVAQGSSQISATSGAVTGTTTMTVGPAALVSIAVTPANPSIAKGTTQQFTATGTYSDSTTQNLTSSVTWASSNTGVATVTSGGLATGVAQSTSMISATSGAVTGSTTLTVGPAALVSIAVTPTNPSIPKGRTQQFTAKGTYSDGSTQDLTTSATWVSATTTVATITAGGLATGVAQGTSQITASTAGVQASTTLTVGPAVLASIAVTPANPTIPKGKTQQFTATGTYTDGSTLNLTSSSTWASSTTTVATITKAGVATARAQGTSTISATSGGVKGTTLMTVGPAALVSIAITPANQTVSVGTKVQYTATGKYTDGTTVNITSSVTWTSSSTAVATITSGGLATAIKTGSTSIKGTSGTIVGSTSLKVQ